MRLQAERRAELRERKRRFFLPFLICMVSTLQTRLCWPLPCSKVRRR